ncbi:MAG: GNAT family N-acetyltransferase [Chloroflexi bacterium]|nr:GNAT family N-acetyltransferase [Chloroflexota bacterium]
MTTLDNPTLALALTVILRPAIQSDLPKLEWYGQYTHFRNLFRRTFREQEQGRRVMLIADCNDFPIGHVFIQIGGGQSRLADGNRRAYLYSLRVMEMFRGQGIGSRLLQEAEVIAAEAGFGWTTIAAAKDNPRARQLYERSGYRVFMEDAGNWSYVDHEGRVRYVHEPCWILEKQLRLR